MATCLRVRPAALADPGKGPAVALDPQLETRLTLLHSSGQVDADIVAFMRAAAPQLGEAVERPVTDAVFGSLITHSLLALQRTRAGEALTSWDTDHTDELAAYPNAIRGAQAFADRAAAELHIDVPGQEREFMALHLAAIEQGAA